MTSQAEKIQSLEDQLQLYRENLKKEHNHADAKSLIMECYRGGIIDMVWLEMLVKVKFDEIEDLKSMTKKEL